MSGSIDSNGQGTIVNCHGICRVNVSNLNIELDDLK